jgi:lipid-A-disaccharide synthase
MKLRAQTMNDAFRAYIYPLGFLSSFAFGLRFLVQWWVSEIQKRSVSLPLFWKLSLVGNILLFAHSVVQVQFPMALTQALLAVLSWRNLNLMEPEQKRFRLVTVIGFLLLTTLATTSLFFVQGIFFDDNKSAWLRSPPALGFSQPIELPFFLHVIGIFGVVIFSLRFWIQWWQTEQSQKSEFRKSFWYLSLFGAIISIFYFLLLQDPVNATGPLLALVPYIRNLMLTYSEEKLEDAPDSKVKPSIFIFAGEVSADLYGKEIINQLKQKVPDLEFFGVGGPSMELAGFKSFMPMSNFQVMGISSVIKRLPWLFLHFFKLKSKIINKKPLLCLFIDQPDFSMRLARSLRKAHFSGKIVQFVAPTVWAYRKKRAEALAKDFDLLLTLFPFEKEHFAHTSLKTVWVGHPIVEIMDEALLPEKEQLVTIFPGSRPQEIVKNLEKQLEAACRFSQLLPKLQIAISLANEAFEPWVIKVIEKARKKTGYTNAISLFSFADRHKLMQRASFALAKSGTVTLELALNQVPTVVTYELSALNRFVAKYIFKLNIPFFCIVNILKQKEVFFELIKTKVTPQDILDKLLLLHEDKKLHTSCKKECSELKALLQAHKKPIVIAAESIMAILHET